MATIQLGKVPGVYSQEEINPELAITEQKLKVAGLVGHASPDLILTDFKVVRGSEDTDTLGNYAGNNVLDVLCVSSYVGAYNTNLPKYKSATDYTWEKGASGNIITWNEPSAGTVVNPEEGSTYYVTMKIKKDASFYVPKYWNDINAIKAYYGPEYYTDGEGEEKVNEISLGARLMFNNGADVLYICEAEPGSNGEVVNTNVQKAIDYFGDIDIQTLLCMPQSADLQQYVASKVVIDSSTENGKERIAWVAALSDDADTIAEQSKAFKEQRIVNIAPSKVTVLAENADGEAKEFSVSSIYAAAALTGMTTNNTLTVAEPLTRKNPVGIYGLSKEYTRTKKEKLSAAGTTVLVTRNGAVSVNQAVTTDNTNQNKREVSVVLIKDEVIKTIRYNLDKEYIGHFYDRNSTPTRIKSSIMLMLNDMVGSLIQGYDASDIIVTPDADDTTRVNVKMAFSVLRPLNYIYISFQVTI